MLHVRKNYLRTKKADDRDMALFLDLVKSCPDFAEDYAELHAQYGFLFRMSAKSPSVNLRTPGRGLDRCFFHTHAKNEVCHLEAESDENDAGKENAQT